MSATVATVVRVGTRASPLALAQARMTLEALRAADATVDVRVVEVRTTGDRRLDAALADAGTGTLPRGLFTKELEEALLSGTVDVAVHSLKDLPTELPPGLVLGGVLPRASAEDVLLTRDGIRFADLPAGAVIATSSERRRRMLLWKRPDLVVVPVRGNIGTRLRKLVGDPGWAGMVLARAGLERLGCVTADGRRVAAGDAWLELENLADWMVPAPGQGAVGLETRESDVALLELLARIGDPGTLACVRAERFFLERVGGGCHHPVGAHARIEGDRLHLAALCFEVGPEPRSGGCRGSVTDPAGVAAALHAQLYG
jgi:hydroxymethylbilane synthase